MNDRIEPATSTTIKSCVFRLVKRLDCLITRKVTGLFFLGLVAVWFLYGLLGHRIIHTMYRADSNHILGHPVMAGKSQTPLEDYLEAADIMIVVGTFRVIAAILLLALLIKMPLGVVYGFGSAVALSFIAFGLIQLVPSLGSSFYLDRIGSHYFRTLYVANDQLVHKLKPYVRTKLHAFGDEYPPAYGIEVKPRIIDWITDEDGFRNKDTIRFSDVLVIGDGMIEDGDNVGDTFPARLAKHLQAANVRNLGTGGYGPFQYIEVLKRYGLKRKPRVALIAFNEGNDLTDVETYIKWKMAMQNGAEPVYDSRTPVLSQTLFERYLRFLAEVSDRLKKAGLTAGGRMLSKLNAAGQTEPVHPDAALVDIGGKTVHALLFIDKLITRSSEEILASEMGRRLREILVEFKNVCEQNKIVPLVMFVPSAAHVYADYSTERSGRNWLKIRAEQIASKQNVERAIATLAANVGVELINLSSVFEAAAKSGRMLYYPLSSHWNSEGMEVAAGFVAGTLKSKMPSLGDDVRAMHASTR
jgi:hypothetical protein